MRYVVNEVLQVVTTEKEAQEVIAALTEKYASLSAKETFKEEGGFQKRSWRKVAYHTAGNLLRRGTTRRFDY